MLNSIKSRLLWRAVFLLVLVYVLNYIANVFYYHWTDWWYDVILHFLGGACAGTGFLFLYFIFLKISNFEKIKAIKLTFFFVFLVGFVWEIYELKSGATSFFDGIIYVRDTLSDLIIDCCGGFFATLYSFKYFKNLSGKI